MENDRVRTASEGGEDETFAVYADDDALGSVKAGAANESGHSDSTGKAFK